MPTPTSVIVLFFSRERAFWSRTRTVENASCGWRYFWLHPRRREDMVPKVGSSTPQFGANTSVKSSFSGWQWMVLLLLQFCLHSCAYCRAMQPRPRLLLSLGSFWNVRLLLMISRRSLAAFPTECKNSEKPSLLLYVTNNAKGNMVRNALHGYYWFSDCLTKSMILE